MTRMSSYSYNRPPNEGVTDLLETAGQRQKAARAASPISSATDRLALQPAGQDVGITAKMPAHRTSTASRLGRYLGRFGMEDSGRRKGRRGKKQFKIDDGLGKLVQVTAAAAVSVGRGPLQVSNELRAWLGCVQCAVCSVQSGWLHPPTMV